MAKLDDEEQLLRSVALQNANTIQVARLRAEDELLQTKEALRQNEERLRAIFNQAAVGIAVASLDGRFLDMNRKFSEILGYDADELRGLTFADITHPDDLADTTAAMTELLAGSRSEYALEKRYVRKDGTIVWNMATVTFLRGASGQPQRFIGVIEDITPRKLAEAALREAAEQRKLLLDSERAARTEAERMSELKDDFLATLSHELRTPLNAILGWSQVLRSRPRDQIDYEKGLEAIERNARVQTQLIEDLLDMSRITSGKLRLDVQSLEAAPLIEAAVETVAPAAEVKGIRLESIIDPAAGPISGDPGRLQQIIWNLLSNAIKFTPKHGTVQIVLERINSHIEISVADTGIGIKPDIIPILFERFRQGDASVTRNYGGLGLGLSIVKSLVELHGGTVEVRSPGIGQGTTVTVQLPLTVLRRDGPTGERVHPKTPKVPAPGVSAVELAGLTVLVVDDQADARDLIRRVLEDAAATVLTAATAAAALALVSAHHPDVLISDIGMPDADGFDLLRRVRALGPDGGGKLPAIALTAFARSEDRTRALRAGFVVHVAKPVDPAELVITVASVARRAADAAALDRLASAGRSHASPLGLPVGCQVYPHRGLLKDLPAFCRTMAGLGVTRLELCSPIGYGVEFASLADGQEVKRILADHGMKSESSHFGLKELREQQSRSIAWAANAGITQMICASLSDGNGGNAPTLDQLKQAADEYNTIAAAAARAGMQQGLHNEGFERSIIEGRRTYDRLLDLLDPQLVTFQFQMSEITAGMDAVEYFTKYPGRFTSMHVQDIDMNAPVPPPAPGERARGRPQVAVGKGTIDWAKTFKVAQAAGVRSYFVEQSMELTIESVAALKAMTV